MSLRCYMLELIMVIDEEEIMNNNAGCINDFSDTLPKANSVSPVYKILLGASVLKYERKCAYFFKLPVILA